MAPKTSGKAAKKSGKAQKNISPLKPLPQPCCLASQGQEAKGPKGQGKPKKPSTHPGERYGGCCYQNLKERNGSSLAGHQEVHCCQLQMRFRQACPFLKKALKNGVEKGKFVQTKELVPPDRSN
ncbi:histone H1B-like [Aedes aegypti]|uniref:H15 domain-containing protein n=1 Tax=Aedes aegypti TaxID=7159 RepID=A0A903VLH8_AEDAE|nr:histone H1B-like [Aedes aegypti]